MDFMQLFTFSPSRIVSNVLLLESGIVARAKKLSPEVRGQCQPLLLLLSAGMQLTVMCNWS